ncbi:hypothetical protein ONO23_03808 [Micromonospora noduli]|uniref:Uncharacterized protein n=1 Tax=Micromonospora noduli TaxID=709876 RepID=A0ABX9D8R9_9ACTN|nr:hypothetical protein [Micromonospora noduli]RAO24684.1 hypothetical protein MED15_00442 [Micromonospora noduli]RAO31413.1 hypothetical protein ONO23_03808 [Micromonospora noduli]
MTDPTTPKPPDPPTEPPQPPMSPVASPTHEANLVAGAGTATPEKRSKVRAWVVGGIALAVILCCGGAVIGTFNGDESKPTAGASSSPAASPTSASPTTITPTTAAPTSAAPTSAIPSPTKAAPPPKPKPPSYKTLTERQWKLIAKDPDGYLGKTYVVYGRVTQFDAATGTDSFRADVAHRRMAEDYDYETNTILNGSASDLDNLVEDDIFRANVTVLGSFSYDTQIGGETTVALLQVDSIKVL